MSETECISMNTQLKFFVIGRVDVKVLTRGKKHDLKRRERKNRVSSALRYIIHKFPIS